MLSPRQRKITKIPKIAKKKSKGKAFGSKSKATLLSLAKKHTMEELQAKKSKNSTLRESMTIPSQNNKNIKLFLNNKFQNITQNAFEQYNNKRQKPYSQAVREKRRDKFYLWLKLSKTKAFKKIF